MDATRLDSAWSQLNAIGCTKTRGRVSKLLVHAIMPAIHHTLPASGATTSTKAVVSKTTANTEQGAPFLGKVEVPTEKEVYRFNASIGANNTERVIQSGDKEPSDGGVQGENPANGSRTESKTKAGNDSGDKESDDSNESEFDAFEVRICV